ncbi:MAG: hypothetical protein V4443_11215 [Pseudomonadota bacterium]
MSNSQNLAYTVVQVFHNFGAVAAVGGSLAATLAPAIQYRRKLAWLTLAGWGTQAASGASFGMVSYQFYGKFPDIAGVALDALIIKMLCVASGFLLVGFYLFRGQTWSAATQNRVWPISSALAVTAISAAAFLRWFS